MSEIGQAYGGDQQRAADTGLVRFLDLANLGRVVVTPGAARVLEETETEVIALLARHAASDWGQVDQDDRDANNRALLSGLARTYSNYQLYSGQCIWVVTEADRSATVMCLPDEYL